MFKLFFLNTAELSVNQYFSFSASWILMFWDDTKRHEVKNSLDVDMDDMDDQNEISQATAKYGDGKYYPCSIVAKSCESFGFSISMSLVLSTKNRKGKLTRTMSSEAPQSNSLFLSWSTCCINYV